jgi:hypothetical protein
MATTMTAPPRAGTEGPRHWLGGLCIDASILIYASFLIIASFSFTIIAC